MNCYTLKNKIVDLLGDGSLDRFSVVGYKKKAESDVGTKDDYRSVQIIMNEGQFPSNKRNGPFKHDIDFIIRITSSKSAKMNIATIEDDGSTTEEKIEAINEAQNSTALAQDSAFECFDIVFGIISDSTNYSFNENGYNRNIKGWKSKPPMKFGRLTLFEIDFFISISVDETIGGATPVESEEPILETTVNVYDMDEQDNDQDFVINDEE
jgi:hypothetical protein